MSILQIYYSVPLIERAMRGELGMTCEVNINGKWYRVRRNGALKSYKRDPHRYRLPFKARFRDCGYVASRTDSGGVVRTDCWLRHMRVSMRYGNPDNWTIID
jgi:hypothetical protein